MRTLALTMAAMLLGGSIVAATQDAEVAQVKLAEAILELKAGTPAEVTLPADTAILQGFSFEVPRDAKSMFLVVSDANADIDMVLLRGSKAKDYEDLADRAVLDRTTPRVNETVMLDATTEPPLKPGKWWVYAGSLVAEAEEELTFTMTLTFDKPPEAARAAVAPFRAMAGLAPMQRALDACVRLDTEFGTGSGTVVTPGGLIVTCLHVLTDDNDQPVSEGIYVSFTHSPRQVARQSHLAKLVASDKALDLAMVQIVADLDGKPIEKPNFTWLPLARSEPELDDDLRCIGYPAIGGARSLCSISLTRGVVSGFVERKGRLQWLKSDCLISAGNSGGTAVNARWEFAGIPTEVLQDSETMESLGYIRPVSAIPAKWQETIAAGAK
ncbi:MAG: trypsin-like peptidase domain-containing protein [Planctomycetes bacterium]|nr:trypsin-like peptidase domain-containing protein [Planctomycetota bacterium]